MSDTDDILDQQYKTKKAVTNLNRTYVPPNTEQYTGSPGSCMFYIK